MGLARFWREAKAGLLSSDRSEKDLTEKRPSRSSSSERRSDMDANKVNGSGNASKGSNEWRVKVGLAEMLKGGVIMDVTNAEQAKIAEKAGARAVMAGERRASGIPKEGWAAAQAALKR